ncbi:MAG: TadE family protein [Jatrophihabitans sp.]|nr:TadE family protein [Jatrophihabitans sp.]
MIRRPAGHKPQHPTQRESMSLMAARRRGAGLARGCVEEGAAAVMLLLLTPALFGLAGLVLDGGRQLAARQQAVDLAEQAARAGADRLDTDATRSTGSTGYLDIASAQDAACRYVTLSDPQATCRATVTTTSEGQRVHVEVTASSATVLLGLVGVNRLHVHSIADATAVTGIRTVLGHG